MGRILRVGLMVLLVAAAGVGNVWGEEVWVTSGNWQYAKINETTCRIKTHGSATIEGTVKIPDEVGSLKVVEIAKEAFEGCSKLEAVDIPNSVKAIGKSAFYGCVKLMKMFISSSVREIGDNAFSYCKELTAFQVDEGNAWYSQDSGVLFTKDMQMLIAYPGGRKGAYEIPGSVTGIVAGAFYGCDGLTAVVIPSSVKSILEWTFCGCTGLTAVTIPDGVTDIKEYAFDVCKNLKEVTIPGSVKTIGGRAFFGCVSLNTVYVYRPVDQEFTVDETAFADIGSQATLYVRPGMKAKIKNEEWHKNIFTNIVEFCVVTFTDSDGTKLGEQLVKPNNGTATAPTAAPTREGYIFDGWQLNGAKYDFSTPVTKNITLVAVWKEVAKYTVTFDAKGGTPAPGAQKVVKDGTATAPTAPTREGYIFDGWQLDGAKYDFSAPVTKDITLVAEWKKNEESTPSTPKDPKDPETAVESVQLAGVRVVRNPVGEALELEGMECAARVEVYSVVGVRVHAEVLRGEPRVVIDAHGWAHGVYVVRVVASDGARTLRVVK